MLELELNRAHEHIEFLSKVDSRAEAKTLQIAPEKTTEEEETKHPRVASNAKPETSKKPLKPAHKPESRANLADVTFSLTTANGRAFAGEHKHGEGTATLQQATACDHRQEVGGVGQVAERSGGAAVGEPGFEGEN